MAAPANDTFAAATTLSGAAGSVTATTVEATKETGEPDHAGYAGGASIWFSWTAPSSFEVTFSLEGSAFDTLLAVYTGSAVAALTLVVDNDQYFGNQSRVRFDAVEATTYRIAVDGYGGASGSVALRWGAQAPVPPVPMTYVGAGILDWNDDGGTIAVPAGARPGDLLVCVVLANWTSGALEPIIGPGWDGPLMADAVDLAIGSHVVAAGDPATYEISMPLDVGFFDNIHHDSPGGVAVVMAWRGIETFTVATTVDALTDSIPDSAATPPYSGLPDRRVVLAVYALLAQAHWTVLNPDDAGSQTHFDTFDQSAEWATAVDPLGNFIFAEIVNAPGALSVQAAAASEGLPDAVGAIAAERIGAFAFVDPPPSPGVRTQRQIAAVIALAGFEATEEWVQATPPDVTVPAFCPPNGACLVAPGPLRLRADDPVQMRLDRPGRQPASVTAVAL